MLVETERRGGIVTLTLNRPESRNALSIEMCEAIVDALRSIEDERDARAIVVRGSGKAFCSGADFAAVSGPDGEGFVPAFEHMLEHLARHRVPTIAAIHGAALGGGLQVATVCDFRVVADDAKLGIPSSKLGILVNFENIQRLVLLVGIATAKEILMTGRTWSGAEAVGLGLVNQSIAAGELETAATEWADEIASLAPLSVQGVKRAVQVVADHLGAARATIPHAVADIDGLVAEAYGSNDLAEGLKAMGERRPPRFTGA